MRQAWLTQATMEWTQAGSSRKPLNLKCLHCAGNVCAGCGRLAAEDGIGGAFCHPCVELVPSRGLLYESAESKPQRQTHLSRSVTA